MDGFISVLQGSYGYLLIGQIFAVTAIFVLLIMLIMGRVKQAVAEGAIEPERVFSSSEEALIAMGEERAQIKVRAAFAEASDAQEKASQLTQKVQYLESKLLEYEILQEEIGNITNLRKENVDLKEEVQQLKEGGATAAMPNAIVTIEEPVAAAPTPEPPAAEPEVPQDPMASLEAEIGVVGAAVEETQSASEASPEAEAPAAVEEAKPEENGAPSSEPEAATVPAPAKPAAEKKAESQTSSEQEIVPPEIESLLAEIDQMAEKDKATG